MRVKFWGTRGSIAKPGPGTLRYGGNTSCVEVRSSEGTLVILDCGTGLQNLGQELMASEPRPVRGHVLISHTHWDHIQGIPFFAPFFAKGNEWDVYAPRGLSQSVRETLAGQMQYTYFPVTLEAMGATIRYHDLLEGVFDIGDVTVQTQYLNHPALTLGYRLTSGGVSVVYASDHEPHSRKLATGTGDIGGQDRHHVEFLRDADLVIHDAQFTEDEYPDRVGWGHSTLNYALEMCVAADAKQLALSHHDPLRTDDQVDRLEETARARLKDRGSRLEAFAAAEGRVVELGTKAGSARARGKGEFSATTPVASALWQDSVLLGIADPDTASLLSQAARADNIPVMVEDDVQSILRIYAAKQPSLIILDKEIAGDGRLNACRAIRGIADDHARDVPIIVVADREKIDEGIDAGVTDWLIEPFSQEYARTRMRAWLLRSTCRWLRARLPADEDKRQAALQKLDILDSDPDERFDRITRLAAATFDVPIALVSLVDGRRQWFKSCYGLAAGETSREMSFCAHAILNKEVMVVNDALVDPRFADNPFVTGEPRVRFYAGFPLSLSDGSRVGTLCVIDTRPRDFDATKVDLLKDFGTMVERELETA